MDLTHTLKSVNKCVAKYRLELIRINGPIHQHHPSVSALLVKCHTRSYTSPTNFFVPSILEQDLPHKLPHSR